MTAVQTITKTVEGIEIAIPVGSMDRPSERSEQIMKASQDPRNWKYPIPMFHTYDKSEAEDLAYCYDWYCGGHETEQHKTAKGILYGVSTKGYYHYIGS